MNTEQNPSLVRRDICVSTKRREMKQDLIEIESFCQVNDICCGCPYEDECFDSFMMFGVLHAKEWIEHFTCIIYADGEY